MTASHQDQTMMARALTLAAKGRYTTTPNPNVGCVITSGNTIIGEGYHAFPGEPHAEVHALKAAGDNAKGATAYVTLEPCSHHGRTPPCCDALIAAQVSRVVCAMQDPNPQVAGRGIARLKAAGVEVAVGLMAEQAKALNPGFIKRMKTGMPYVQLKLAGSLDGRTALANGESQWITGAAARADVQRWRAQASAILSTSETVLADNPSLNVRSTQLPDDVQNAYPKADLRQPTRVILDRYNRTSPDATVYQLSGPVIRVVDQPSDHLWPEQVSEWIMPGAGLAEILQVLAKHNMNTVWVEAGATLAGALLTDALVDELIVYQAPVLMGADSRPLLALEGYQTMSALTRFHFDEITPVGEDIRMRATLSEHASKASLQPLNRQK
ncbi:bifunctional diaminohydroxyphosphoribosylaminopyrimidine deaminase/5-amino-6-(5-phosphoribosylamino)uracil reductase RibD [Salinivibrio sp. ES.052]|uniref:bifunctional diaminohydroxyphosphoribosylaminopyrimidine deaminase/5-amino-6-(5-phosphoribosylamino)uracil reductase RibD n=1 Tax=Salinivibrio sp. ES.052 TaxID=1882823 RepID=UPI000926940B|nr:bifunctional diaminohydroxyphosphoribosylaminopyrimidine deaminase/5-amino-6-(5-phosphoribosylamino)uracil reductase RibD [Salinivibrio sp. ES.052]SIN74911.1 diaminohydroxyphosphoribosylaminopyrimidine deaminase [Salinivibrio sp. ES.052]